MATEALFTAKVDLSPEEKVEMFFECEKKTYDEVALAYGLDKHFPDKVSRTNKMARIFKDVAENPVKYNVAESEVLRVVEAKNKRSAAPPTRAATALVVKPLPGKDVPLKDLVISVRDQALGLIRQKLNSLEGDNIDDVKLVELTTAFGTLFDKTRIVMGEATENIAIMAKVDPNMKPEDALRAVIAMREANQEDLNKPRLK